MDSVYVPSEPLFYEKSLVITDSLEVCSFLAPSESQARANQESPDQYQYPSTQASSRLIEILQIMIGYPSDTLLEFWAVE